MLIHWRDRLLAHPDLADINQWPFVDASALSRRRREAYLRNRRILARVLGGESQKAVALDYGLTPSRVSRLLTRCLGGDIDTPPRLSMGLIPHQQGEVPVRRRPLPRISQEGGAKACFQALLNHVPGLKAHLDRMIRAHVSGRHQGQNLAPKPVHSAFITYLREANWPDDCYPFTHSSWAYESVRTYFRRREQEMAMPNTPRRVISSRDTTSRIFQEVQIDEHLVDCASHIGVDVGGNIQAIRLARITLLLARDVASGAYLGYVLAMTRHPSASDMVALLNQLVYPWEPQALNTPGLHYTPGAIFPSALGASFCRPSIGIVRLDNAMAHRAERLVVRLCDELGATVNFGLPAQPKARGLIEQAFKYLNVDVHRIASTTGSHPLDPKRERRRHSKRPPLISLQALEEAIGVVLTEHNIRPVGNLVGVSPLDMMRRQMAHHLVPLRPPPLDRLPSPYHESRAVRVRKPKADKHAPHIYFEKVLYRGEAINQAALINQPVQVIYDTRDIRYLDVITEDGRHLGEVRAPKSWQRFAHSLALRKKINRHLRHHLIERHDPLAGYFQYCLTHRDKPSIALDLVSLCRDMNLPSAAASVETKPARRSQTTNPGSKASDSHKKVSTWSPSMVKQRR
ncbi:hypothetical protein [Spongiibacter marinus]|uniref:hypothetical protein n=1 Tax=Spongiibacter marinus TaxID=354246 RepID=UPI001961FE54|nr:hypothetical protein [Spongiibacter marinus]MBM7425040.1 hypothetical protein [Spongiibacter marinus]